MKDIDVLYKYYSKISEFINTYNSNLKDPYKSCTWHTCLIYTFHQFEKCILYKINKSQNKNREWKLILTFFDKNQNVPISITEIEIIDERLDEFVNDVIKRRNFIFFELDII